MTVKRTRNCQYMSVHCPSIAHAFKELLLELSLCNLDFHGLINLLRMAALVIGVVLDSGREESVDEGCLS